MKTRFLLFGTLLGVAGSIIASPLTPGEALSRLKADRKTIGSLSATVAPVPAYTVTLPGTGDPGIYLFRQGDDGRILFVGADTRANSLLGYTDPTDRTFDYESLPPQLRWWLSEYAGMIAGTPENNDIPTVVNTRATRILYPAEERKAILPLLKTRWNQTAPFNRQCPGNAVVGCMGVALAQTVKYFGYPAKGSGTAVAVAPDGQRVSMDLGVEFDWNNMLDEYVNGSYTSTQENAVAEFCKTMAFACETTFGTDMSSALLSSWLPAVYNRLGYEKTAVDAKRMDFTDEEWSDKVYANLAEVGPVPYFGGGVQGFHAFVCDGYSEDGLFHFNWGWGGYCDGYFNLNALNPSGYGTGGFASGYNLSQSAIFGMRPPRETVPQVNHRLLMEGNGVTGYVQGNSAGIRCTGGGWYNVCGMNLDFELALEFEDTESGRKIYSATSVENVSDNSGFGMWSTRRIPEDLTDGTWMVRLVARTYAGADWEPAYHPINTPDYFIIDKDGSTLETINVGSRSLTVEEAELKTALAVDKLSKISFRVTNETERYVEQRLAPGVCTSQGLMLASGDNVFVALAPGESKDVDFSFYTYSTGSGTIVNGVSYRFLLYDADTREILKEVKNIGFAPTKYGEDLMECESFTLRGDNSKADPQDLVFDVALKATRWYVGNQLLVAIFKNSANILRHTHDEPVMLSPGEAGAYEIHVSLPEGEVGEFAARPFYFESSMNRYFPLMDDRIYFSTENSVVEAVERDGAALAFLDNNAGLLVADAPNGISRVEVYSADGRLLLAHSANGERTVNLNAGRLSKGVLIVRILDVDGIASVTRLIYAD